MGSDGLKLTVILSSVDTKSLGLLPLLIEVTKSSFIWIISFDGLLCDLIFISKPELLPT